MVLNQVVDKIALIGVLNRNPVSGRASSITGAPPFATLNVAAKRQWRTLALHALNWFHSGANRFNVNRSWSVLSMRKFTVVT